MNTLNITIDFSVLKQNIEKIKAHTHANKILLPVKSNAYGHGMIEVAKYCEQENLIDYLGVAHFNEAMEIRNSGVKTDILVMSPSLINETEYKQAATQNIHITVSSKNTLEQCKKFGVSIHLSLDTGMGREGMFLEDLPEILHRIKEEQIELKGVMTHFAVSDEFDSQSQTFTQHQIENFESAKKLVQEQFPKQNILFHTANSGGVLGYKESIHTMIRPGIAAYGYPEGENCLALEPVMTASSYIGLIKTYPKNYRLGYGCTHTTETNERVGLVPVGYGDGLFRNLSEKLTPYINGKKQKCLGRISMDQFAVSLEKSDTEGDIVEILGRKNTAKNIADQSGTISYEVLCALGNGPRAKKEYLFYSSS